jgi:hypothetical protein
MYGIIINDNAKHTLSECGAVIKKIANDAKDNLKDKEVDKMPDKSDGITMFVEKPTKKKGKGRNR